MGAAGAAGLEVVERALVDQRRHRHVPHHLAVAQHAQAAAVGDLADGGRADLPALAQRDHLVDPRGLDHREHPLLGLGDHDLEGLHVGLAQGDAGHVEVDPHAAAARHLSRRGGQARGAQVLERDQQLGLKQLEAQLDQLALLERVADLDGGPLGLVLLVELGRGQDGGAADPVAAGRGAHEHDDVARTGGGAADQPRVLGQAEAHRVDQAVGLVGRLEVDLAADRRHADRVAVVADARDGAVEEVAGPPGRRLPEAQRVEHGDGPGADREHVAQDPADAGGRSLEGLDRARVVVRLHLEGAGQAAADVDGAGVLARAHEDVLALGGQPAQQLARVLVGAVLGPQQREHRQLDLVGRAAQLLHDQLVLGRGEAERDRLVDAGERHRVRHGRRRSPSTGRWPARRSSR